MTGMWRYIRLLARSGRFALLGWPIGLALLYAGTGGSIIGLYRTPEEIATYQQAINVSPIMQAVTGASGGLDSIAGIIANEMAVMVLTLLPVAAVLLAVGRTRSEEDAGRTELVTAMPISPRAPFAAGTVVVAGSLALTAVLAAAIIIGLDPARAGTTATYGLTVFSYGWFYAGLGFLLAQMFAEARAAKVAGISLGLGLYLLRVLVLGSGNCAEWAGPARWFDVAVPFSGHGKLWGIGVLFGGGIAFTALGWHLHSRRDIATGTLPVRPGRAHAPHWYGTPLGLFWRLNRGAILGWLVGVVVFAAVFGGLADKWLEIFEVSGDLVNDLGYATGLDTITWMGGLCLVLFAMAAGISTVGTFAKQERTGQLAHVLAAPISRQQMWSRWLGGALGVTIALVAIGALVYAGTAWMSVGEAAEPLRALGSLILFAAPAGFVVTLAGLGFALHNSGHFLGWALLALSFTFGFFSGLFKLPAWIENISPVNSIGFVPVEPPVWLWIGIQAVVIVMAFSGAIRLFLRRDLVTG